MKLSVIVPLYNEELTVVDVLTKLVNLEVVNEIVVVDDCSSDDSFNRVKQMSSGKIKLLQHSKNQGKTAALKTGVAQAEGEVIIIQDADEEYDPNEIPMLVEPILTGHADVVYGSRFASKKSGEVLYYYHYLANRLLTILSNLFNNRHLTDIETCYKACRAPILKNLNFSSSGFGFEVEITASVCRLPIRLYEMPISYHGRTYEQGKKIGLSDGVAAIFYILYFNLWSTRGRSFRGYRQSVLAELNAKN